MCNTNIKWKDETANKITVQDEKVREIVTEKDSNGKEYEDLILVIPEKEQKPEEIYSHTEYCM